jgi:predicted Zn-dependent protease
MSGLFYNLGRRLGRAAVPAIRKGRWIWDGLTGNEEDALRAERSLGAALATEVRASTAPGLPADTALVQDIGCRLSKGVPDRRRRWRIEVIVADDPNAMALPGGFLFVSHALLDLCDRRREELAFVLGHEMAHVLLGHAWDRMINQSALRAASVVVARAGPLGPWLRQNGLQLLQSAHARDCEFEADREGLRLVVHAGYDSAGGVQLFRRLEGLGSDPAGLGQYFASHPPAAERMAKLKRLGPEQGD